MDYMTSNLRCRVKDEKARAEQRPCMTNDRLDIGRISVNNFQRARKNRLFESSSAPQERATRMSSYAATSSARHPDNDYITELNDNDVLCGRGALSDRFEGNVRFRAIIKERRFEYRSAKKPNLKATIAQEIVNRIHSNGGRFLRKVELLNESRRLGVPADTQAWVPVDESVALDKVKQALREIPSDESRAARQSPDTGMQYHASPRALARETDIRPLVQHALAQAGRMGFAGQSRTSLPGGTAPISSGIPQINLGVPQSVRDPYAASTLRSHELGMQQHQHQHHQQQPQHQQPQQHPQQQDRAALLLELLADQARSRDSAQQHDLMRSLPPAALSQRAPPMPFAQDSLRQSAILRFEREQEQLRNAIGRGSFSGSSQTSDLVHRGTGHPGPRGDWTAPSSRLSLPPYSSRPADIAANPQTLTPETLLQIQRDNNLRHYLGSRVAGSDADPPTSTRQPFRGNLTNPSATTYPDMREAPLHPNLLPAALGPIASLRPPSEIRPGDPYRALLADSNLQQQHQIRGSESLQEQLNRTLPQRQPESTTPALFPLDDATCDRVATSWKAIPGTYRDLLAMERERPFTGQDLNILLLTRAWAEVSRDYDCLEQIRTVLGLVLQLESSLLRLSQPELQILVSEFYAMPSNTEGSSSLRSAGVALGGSDLALTGRGALPRHPEAGEPRANVTGTGASSPESSRKRKASDTGQSG